MRKKLMLFILIFATSYMIFAHPGRLAKDGCHNDRKTGERHCHGGSASNMEEKNSLQYERRHYGGWIDADGDGQNTRQEVLIEENIGVLVFSSDGTKVLSGEWHDPYTGQIFTNPSDLDIDHFVPLKEAHISGAAQWSRALKKKYANYLDDPRHLIAVSKSANRSKGSRDPSSYLPPNKKYVCTYLATWVAIKQKWQLEIDAREARSIVETRKSHHCE